MARIPQLATSQARSDASCLGFALQHHSVEDAQDAAPSPEDKRPLANRVFILAESSPSVTSPRLVEPAGPSPRYHCSRRSSAESTTTVGWPAVLHSWAPTQTSESFRDALQSSDPGLACDHNLNGTQAVGITTRAAPIIARLGSPSPVRRRSIAAPSRPARAALADPLPAPRPPRAYPSGALD